MKSDKTCKNCAYYERYHRLGLFKFWEENEGNCVKFGETVSENGNCKFWTKTVPDHTVTLRALDIGIENVQTILRYFKDGK